LDAFGAELLRAVALYLELDENWFDDKINVGNSILRLLHYPPQNTPPPEGTERAGAHEDINLITLLLGAEEAGLQAKHRSGQWLDVNAPQGAPSSARYKAVWIWAERRSQTSRQMIISRSA